LRKLVTKEYRRRKVKKLLGMILFGALAVSYAVGQEQQTSSLPNVLIIGDSISVGYTRELQPIIKGKAQVVRISENARDSSYGVKKLDEWLGSEKWDVIHFNHGLHDMVQGYWENDRYVVTDTGKAFIPIDQYKSNLERIVQRFKRTDAKLIFATTTPIPAGTKLWKGSEGYPKEYNKVAVEVMTRNNVEINDLHAFVVPRQKEFQRPKNVHFNADGHKAQAQEVAKHILKAIGDPKLSVGTVLADDSARTVAASGVRGGAGRGDRRR